MRKIVQTIVISLLLFILFLLITFPYSRLGPKVQATLEQSLRAMTGSNVNCDLDSFDFAFPLGFQWKSLTCRNYSDVILEVSSARLSLLTSTTLEGMMGKGKFRISFNPPFKRKPSRVSAQFDNVPVEKVSPLLMTFVARVNPLIPRDLKLTGTLVGKLDMPLQNFAKEKGSIDVKVDNLNLPNQSLLKQLGLKDLSFTKASVKAELSSGKLNVTDTQLISSTISGKIEGQADLQEDFFKSSANLALKWRIQRSDALQSSTLGIILLNTPCPSPDPDGFCTRKVSRLAELGVNL